MSDAFLQLSNLTKRFGTHVAVDDLTLSVPRGTVLALLGPSGSGKTTTLRLLAGFERPDKGTITVDGRDETGRAPAQRHVGMVFQHYALFPHLTVGENVAFGLANDPAVDKARRVSDMLALVDLEGFAERQVSALSGGQQQRVAVARALAPAPRVLLLDEPLSNLDPSLRERTRRELKAALRKRCSTRGGWSRSARPPICMNGRRHSSSPRSLGGRVCWGA
jgi:iron(III) transport system ATP-binding protein